MNSHQQSQNQSLDEYNINNYTTLELVIMLKNFFNLDLKYIRTKTDLINLFNESLDNYKSLNTNKINVISFIREIINKLTTLSNIEILLNDININNESILSSVSRTSIHSSSINSLPLTSEYKEQNERQITEYETITRLYKLFDIEPGNLSIEELDISYDKLKIKATQNITDESTIEIVLTYLKDSHFKLKKYIINKLYGNEINNTSTQISNNNGDSLNQNRYDILSNPSIIENNNNFIIQRNFNGTQDVYINQAPHDVLNPLRKQLTKTIINIDTIFRNGYDNTSPTDYIEQFSEPMQNVISMSLVSLEIPNIWYSFSESSGTNYMKVIFLDFEYNGTTYPERVYTIKIPDGNYTADEFTQMMNNLFMYEASLDSALSTPKDSPIYYIRSSVDNITGRTTFRTVTPPLDYEYTLEQESIWGPSPYVQLLLDGSNNLAYSPNMKIQYYFLTDDQIDTYNSMIIKLDERENVVDDYVYNINYQNDEKSDECIKYNKTLAYNQAYINPKSILFRTAGWMMGFRQPFYEVTNSYYFDFYTGSSVTKIYGNLQSEGIYGSGINTYIYLCIDDFNNNYKRNVISNNETFLLSNNVLAKIPVTASSNALIIYNDNDKINKTREYFGPINISRLKIKLIDKFGNVVNLNGNNYTFTLELTQLY
jgi:hypothetical protein